MKHGDKDGKFLAFELAAVLGVVVGRNSLQTEPEASRGCVQGRCAGVSLGLRNLAGKRRFMGNDDGKVDDWHVPGLWCEASRQRRPAIEAWLDRGLGLHAWLLGDWRAKECAGHSLGVSRQG